MEKLNLSRTTQKAATSNDTHPAHDPIAIIGIGCRFPGEANDPDAFWRILAEGKDVISELPADRWSEQQFYDPQSGKPGKTQSRWAGIVADLDKFDSQFFGISPREAARMDPQQRLLLETAWEAIEDGGQVVEQVGGSNTSVFVGISSWDYSYQVLSYQDRGVINPYSNTGGSHSIAANRISYSFDLRGPSAAVDTACSSALMAVHLACQSIWNDGCLMALAGGVNALLLPDFFVAFSQLNMLSPTGRCKAFDASADGFVRSEGAGMVLLKPLPDAIAHGDRIYAVIRGTAVNQDGRTPGMTVPSEDAQRELLRAACENALVSPSNIQFIEAHGTGTSVGDPIEARALGSVVGAGRSSDNPCLLGSVKTNIGHLEAGAGIASLIKVALAMHHEKIPPHLHFHQPNPEIDFDSLRLRVPMSCEPWPHNDGPMLAGINSFGYGGANAHAIIEQAPESGLPLLESAHVCGANGHELIPLSARTPAALTSFAISLRDFALQSDVNLQDIASNAAHRRSHHHYRTAVIAKSKDEFAERLQSFANDPAATADRIAAQTQPIAFVFSGQGPQWWAMGRELLKDNPVFREVIEQCDDIVRGLGPWSLIEELTANESDSRMSQTSISQPSIFAIQVALAAVWRSWGVKPDMVVGHSVGEVAAAHLAGVFDLDDAMQIIYHRGKCMDLASSRGRMIAAGLTVDEAREFESERVSIAAVNSPSMVTLSGEPESVDAIVRDLEQRQVFCRELQVEYAFHSAQMDPVREQLLEALADIHPRQSTLPIYSTVTGRLAEGTNFGPEYWWHNVRQTVRFAEAMEQIAEAECEVVVEISPHPVLASSVVDCFQSQDKKATVVSSLKRNEDEFEAMLRSLGKLYTTGCAVDWTGVVAKPNRFVRLPSYPWQRQRLWFESDECRTYRHQSPTHPLLGNPQPSPAPAWQNRLDLRLMPYLSDHQVQQATVLPAAVQLEMTIAAAREVLGTTKIRIDDLRLAEPCILFDEDAHWLETRCDDGKVEIHSRLVGDDNWTLHSNSHVRSWSPVARHSKDFDDIRERCTEHCDRDQCYTFFEKLGLNYGPMFQGIVEGWRRDGESLAIVQLPNALQDAADYVIHPSLLDACFQSVIPADVDFDGVVGALYLPVEFEQVRVYSQPNNRVLVHARLLEKTPLQILAEFDVYTEDGQLVMQVEGFRSQRASGTTGEEKIEQLFYGYRWEEQPLVEATTELNGHWMIFADQQDVGDRLVARLRDVGATCTVVESNDVSSRDEMFKLVESVISDHGSCSGIVHLWDLDTPPAQSMFTADLESAQGVGVMSLLHLVQAWDELAGESSSQLFLVTRGAQSVGNQPQTTEVAQSPAIGFGRVVVNEYPRLQCKLIDLDPNIDEFDASQLLSELSVSDDEDEVALRASTRFVHRYVEHKNDPVRVLVNARTDFRLDMSHPGTLDNMFWRKLSRTEPGLGEVEIEVEAAALNFSDVMKVLGLYPGLATGPIPLGAECSGTVTRVGEGMTRISVGDEVLAAAPFALGSHVTTRAELVAQKPQHLSFAEAATIPIAFLTASYALEHLAQLERGEQVLIHSASGGVGLAAIQIARQTGAKLFATAGTDEKRTYLHGIGIDQVMDSRSLAFADQILVQTEGKGVDVILNSLAGDSITRGLESLADYGRFLEIGKRDIYENMRIGLRPMRNNCSFFAIDLDHVMRTRPAKLGQLLQRLIDRFNQRKLTPLDHQVFAADEIVDAFRKMQQGKHIGKLVVSMKRTPARVHHVNTKQIEFRSDASYLITGGFGGFGSAVAKWMVECGARNLALMSRRGMRAENAQLAVEELETMGAKVLVVEADVSQEEDVATALDNIARTFPPLRGVFHAAMVLDDGLLQNLDDDWMQRVMAPKVSGGWNLHQQTLDCQLDHFVLFSSLSSVFGHAGQANYAAANAFLDQLAHYRRANGLPALTINWGYLGDVGYLAARPELGERLERQGVLSFSVQQALSALERAMLRGAIQISVMNVDWSRWRGLGVTGRISPRFSHLLKSAVVDDVSTSIDDLRKAPSAERLNVVDRLVREKISRVLGVSDEKLDGETPLLELGLDSLMAVEFRNWIEAELKTSVPIVQLMRSPSLSRLTELLSDELANAPAATDESDSERENDPRKLLANIDELSHREVDDLLEKLMADNH